MQRMPRLLNIIAALLLVVLPVSNPCTAQGMTLFCTCSLLASGDQACGVEDSECGCCCGEAADEDQGEEPTEPCPGRTRGKRPKAAYSIDSVPNGPEIESPAIDSPREGLALVAAIGWQSEDFVIIPEQARAGCYGRPPPLCLLLTESVRLLL